MARLAHQMAVESPRVIADVVEVSEYPDLARLYNVTGVPKIVLNDQMELVGAQPESTLVAAVRQLGDESGEEGGPPAGVAS